VSSQTKLIAALCAVLGTVIIAPSASATTTWRMNERPSARIMHDTTNTFNGRIGRRVQPGRGFYRFPGFSGDISRQNLVRFRDDARLDPGSGSFLVVIRFRARHQVVGPNLIQKGQSRQTGGFWKVEIHKDRPTCHFRDASGTISAARGPRVVTDRRWHTIRCSRGPAGTRIVVRTGRHKVVKVNPKQIGWINNSRPMVIGGKHDCAGIDKPPARACDYFRGHVGLLRIRKET
jgi:hypothetical protein